MPGHRAFAPRLLTALALLTALSGHPAGSQVATLVRNLNTRPVQYLTSTLPSQLLSVGNQVFFVAEGSGGEIWVSDGTPSGTRSLGGRGARILGSVRGVVFWVEDDQDSGSRLWRTDGTRAGTFELTGPEWRLTDPSYGPTGYVLTGDLLYFLGCVDEVDCELWRSDGTAAGTSMTRPLGLGSFYYHSGLQALGNKVFVTREGSGTRELWVSDGTPGGTVMVKSLPTYSLDFVGATARQVFFRVGDSPSNLWVSDGTEAGTRPVTQFTSESGVDEWTPGTAAGGNFYFVAHDATHGGELWRSDGTPEGTQRVSEFDFDPTYAWQAAEVRGRLVFVTGGESGPVRLWASQGTLATTTVLSEVCARLCSVGEGYLVQVGDRLVFPASDTAHGDELWSTDGTAQGTGRLADICPGSCGSLESAVAPLLGVGIFAATDSANEEIWRTDGTPGGTRRLARLPRGMEVAAGAGFGALPDGQFLFSVASKGPAGETLGELWAVDGSTEGPRVLTSVPRIDGGSALYPPAALGDRIYFATGTGLWSSSGTPETTSLLVPASSIGGPQRVWAAGGRIFFWLREPAVDWQLWSSDGTAEGTLRVSNVPANTVNFPPPLVPLGTRVYWIQKHYVSDLETWEIWSSDGTQAGTHRAFDLPTGTRSIHYLTAVGGELYFSTFHTANGQEIWKSDGRPAGTRRLTSGVVGTLSPYSEPQFTRVGSVVMFLGYDDEGNYQLWKTDGTPAGTVPFYPLPRSSYDFPSDFTAHRGALYFMAPVDTGDSCALWRSDGTAAGTGPLHEFAADADSDCGSYLPPDPQSLGDFLVFVADDGVHGLEPWRTDGTAAGTVLLRDIAAGPSGSDPGELVVAGGTLYFPATDLFHGVELWRSDGTTAGTRMVQDLSPGAQSSSPRDLMAAGGRLYFAADDGLWGQELWTLPLTPAAGCQPSTTRLCLGGRFQVEAVWRDFEGHTGVGTAAPLTGDTGTFWFFSPENVEAIVKVLDGRGLNNHFWVFFGGLSSVEYTLTVTDTLTGLTRRYTNPEGVLASVGDTQGFGPRGATKSAATSAASPAPRVSGRAGLAAATGVCEPGPGRLCLNGGRFAVEAVWKDFQGQTGTGKAMSLTSDTGYFWFFGPDNVEVVIKVLDGTALNGKFWVFYGALSNVEYTLTVTDTQTGQVKTYGNPAGRFASAADTGAF